MGANKCVSKSKKEKIHTATLLFEPSQNYDVETFNIQISDVDVFDQISFSSF